MQMPHATNLRIPRLCAPHPSHATTLLAIKIRVLIYARLIMTEYDFKILGADGASTIRKILE